MEDFKMWEETKICTYGAIYKAENDISHSKLQKKTLYVSLGPLEVKIFISTFTYVYSCVSMWRYSHTNALANENQERVVAVITDGCPTWVLETKLRFSIVALSDF